MSIEHEHEDGTIHSHVDGDKPHTHDEQLVQVGDGEVKIYKGSEKKSEDVCQCNPPVRNRLCRLHGG